MSLAVANGVITAASAAPAPPEDPPGEHSRFHGFRVTPHMGLCVTVAQLNSGDAVRTWTIPPAARIRSTTGWSPGAIRPRCAPRPCSSVRPASMCFSFVATGGPSSAPRGSPASSADRA